MQAAQPGFYVSFSGESNKSGESKQPIDNLYAISSAGVVESEAVLDQPGKELRGMVIGPDGDLYVCQAQKKDSAILRFGAPSSGGYTRSFLGNFATPTASPGLDHPYQPAFASGNLFVTSQDTNVVTAFYEPGPPGSVGQPMPLSPFLLHNYPPPSGFYAGTFVAAFSAGVGIPPNTSVPAAQGGLTFIKDSGGASHSVRGLAFDADGHLFVADEAANRVAVYDATQGKLLGAITGSSNQPLAGPVALAIDATNEILYIGSPGNKRIYTYAVGNVASGDFAAQVLIHDDQRLDKLSGIALDGAGNLYTGSRKDDVIYRWSLIDVSPFTFCGPFSDSPELILFVADLAG